MGSFLVVLAALLLALLTVLLPYGTQTPVGTGYLNRPSVQAVAANMIQYHLAAVTFVSASANSGTTWTFTDADQRTVRKASGCSSNYTSGTYSGACADQFTPPSFMGTSTYASGSANIVNWKVHYYTTSRLLVTYGTSSSDVAGYSPTQIAHALDDYNLGGNYTDWFWGVMAGASPFTLSDGASTQALPASCAALGTAPCAAGLVGIVTVIP